MLNSIEKLKNPDKPVQFIRPWTFLYTEKKDTQRLYRESFIACPVNKTDIIIFGGYDNLERQCKDYIVFDTVM